VPDFSSSSTFSADASAATGTVQASLVSVSDADGGFHLQSVESYSIWLFAVVITVISVCHLLVRFRTDPILRASAIRVSRDSASIPEFNPEDLEFKGNLSGESTSSLTNGYRLIGRARRGILKGTSSAAR
jgi:hypothetical protein